MRLHEKLAGVQRLHPDVLVVPECACPEVLFRRVPDLGARDVAWVGQHASKGLAVLSFGAWRLSIDREHDPRGATSLPVHLSGPGSLRLLAVWAVPARAHRPGTRRPEPVSQAFDRLAPFVSSGPCAVAGDFNSALRGALVRTERARSPLARRLAAAGFVCAASTVGTRHPPTFFRHRQARDGTAAPSDRVFLDAASARGVRTVEFGVAWDWVGASDHVPLTVEWTAPGAFADPLSAESSTSART